MNGNITISSWVAIREGCPMKVSVLAGDEAEFTCGTRRDVFEFIIDYEPLRELVRLGTAALAEMDALRAAPESDSAEEGAV
ncbi:hypothetical protein [Actinokineospora sp.]|uniref:hypothetical protein n=1 Tax=Actinokineospora sp. TaxID=1872133 RepID=UPI004037C760